jgi:hypothetical protein
MTGFTTEELAFDYLMWNALVSERRATLNPDIVIWLSVWDCHDLAMNVRDDDERRFERRGHYHGWFDAKKGAGQ